MSKARVNQISDLAAYSGMCVFAQQQGGKVHPVSIELIGEAKRLALDAGSTLSVVILGNKIDEGVESISHYNADRIFYYEHELLENYSTDAYTKIICEFIEEHKPEVMLFGATSFGRDFAPRVAARIGTGLTADCTALEYDAKEKKILQTRPAFGGNLMATIICPANRPQMATIRPGVMRKPECVDKQSSIVKIVPKLSPEDILAQTLKIVVDKVKTVSLVDAEIIVSGGRGLGDADGFALLHKLADSLGGTVGASRAAVESGWIEPSRQIGQTGQTVRPKLYVACGISGAVQHVAGMGESDCIIAINKNPRAPIMKLAHLAVEGDLRTVIPELINQIEQAKESGLCQLGQ
jgi:electron transfer flavoprotein alpha subunit